jgi:GT2 family glycosyltransferase/23S rRNA U2552 (ribose-2'-O)-methylase RlmE/FtsJ
MNVSVLVVNLNNLQFTKDCVSDLISQDCNFNLTIIDQNSSEEGTKEYFSTLPSNIEFIQNESNTPLNRLWNWFVIKSNTPYICLLNNDVRIAPNFLSSSIKVFERESNVGFVNHVSNNKDYQEWSNELNYKVIEEPYRQGWDLIFRKESYNQIPFELSFFYGDDYIYSKLYSSGMKGAYILNSPMIHFERSTTVEKGGQRDASPDGSYFSQLDLEFKNMSFVEELSKWKPEFENLTIKKGFLTYKNILLAQTPNIVKEFSKILYEFDTIIEIGFNRGGLSIWLNDNKRESTKLICYDITNEFNQVSTEEGIDFRIKDCYSNSSINEIKREIIKGGRTLVLCDGGDKNFEFNTFSRFIKKGDVIMCHDYCENQNDYHNITSRIEWPTEGESFYESIKDSIKDNNLLPYKYDEFKNVLWGSFIKDDGIELSILICSLTERRNIFLDRLLDKLESQVKDKNVELLVFSDNAKRSIGQKRNDAIKMANGKYTCFIDDDDLVSDDYVDLVLKEIRDWSPDVIVFDALITFDEQRPKLVKYGREFDYCEKEEAYYRHPNHLMVHKKSNITEWFQDIKTGEDDEWASRMLNRIVTQSRIEKILYYYEYRTTTKKYYE